MPPDRELKRMTADERKKLEADLKALRDHQEQVGAQMQQTAAPGVAAAATTAPAPAASAAAAKPGVNKQAGDRPPDGKRTAKPDGTQAPVTPSQSADAASIR